LNGSRKLAWTVCDRATFRFVHRAADFLG
jgi:hypothetical protein